MGIMDWLFGDIVDHIHNDVGAERHALEASARAWIDRLSTDGLAAVAALLRGADTAENALLVFYFVAWVFFVPALIASMAVMIATVHKVAQSTSSKLYKLALLVLPVLLIVLFVPFPPPPCRPGESFQGRRCVPDPVPNPVPNPDVPQQCPTGEEWRDGMCRPINCPRDTTLKDGTCVPNCRRSPYVVNEWWVSHGGCVDGLKLRSEAAAGTWVGGTGGGKDDHVRLADDDCVTRVDAWMGDSVDMISFATKNGATYGTYGTNGGSRNTWYAPSGQCLAHLTSVPHTPWFSCGNAYVLKWVEPVWGPEKTCT